MIVLVFYTFIMLGKSVWANFQLQKQTDLIKAKIEEVKTQNNNLGNLILYYKSDSFREVEARRKLGLKRPDEKVMNVPVQKFDNFNAEIEAQKNNLAPKIIDTKSSNPSMWWQYLTK
ncbi:MAG: Septum formation initiator [Berkelbacteria bacterium GW2011_GWE1_39_12]|uniref:Septum formation initiator n=1 Tax=Berkelbacteria bacterium GW2011_GWE1_39_12 TaxID=1618337 RepID=A0A0G4B4Q7_9BACT|nr:MAG: Septum formation initiator [Berkelbacteria bacterium GW2011_GWE1_39_12]